MVASLNKVMLIGRLTRDPEMRYTANKLPIASFGFAINRTFKAKDGTKKDEVTFVDVSTFGPTAEFVNQYLVKGREIFIEGRLSLSEWETKEGEKRSKLRINADIIQALSNGNNKTDNTEPDANKPEENGAPF